LTDQDRVVGYPLGQGKRRGEREQCRGGNTKNDMEKPQFHTNLTNSNSSAETGKIIVRRYYRLVCNAIE
jgi:hypothetical protein